MSVDPKAYTILLVDDEPANLDMLGARLSRTGYRICTALSAEAAEEEVQRSPPDLILLDVTMPGISGIEYLGRLRSNPHTRQTPVIMVSAAIDTENIVTAIQNGANDYVTKPVNLPVLLARMETQLRMRANLAHLETQTRILSKLAAVDALTGAYNRRSMGEAFEVEMARSRRSERPLSGLMLDIDHFKQVNDTHGHGAGDRVLTEFTERVRSTLRTTDVLGRCGGEEFCVLLPETDAANAVISAERIRAAIQRAPFKIDGGTIDVTVSIGVESVPANFAGGFEALLGSADRALYRAKREGRNRVCSASTAPARTGGDSPDTTPAINEKSAP